MADDLTIAGLLRTRPFDANGNWTRPWALFFAQLPTSLNAITAAQAGPIYILATGQSNCAGNNDGSGDSSVNPNVKGWDGSRWVVLQEGLSPLGQLQNTSNQPPFSPNTGHPLSNNATWQFAKLLQQETQREVRVLLLAWGGNSIGQWVASGTSSYNYDYIRTQMSAIGNPSIDYFIWDQGEADGFGVGTAYDSPATYLAAFNTLVSQLRAETWFPPTTPIITTGLSTAVTTYYSPGLTQWALAAAPNGDPYVYYASSDGLANIGDSVHFTGPALVTLGQRYYDALRTPRRGTVQLLTASERNFAQVYGVAWPDVPVLNVTGAGSPDATPILTRFEAGEWRNYGADAGYFPTGQGSGVWVFGLRTAYNAVSLIGAVTIDQLGTGGACRVALRDSAGAVQILLQGDGSATRFAGLVIGGAPGAANTTGIDALSGARFYQRDGAGNIGTFLSGNGAPSYVSGAFGIGGSTGPTWTFGAGPASAAAPDGSMYSNTTGGVGSTLYVRVAGAWSAIA